MQCPACANPLTERLTRNGVLIDQCPGCNGLWLDRGEVYLFSDQPQELQRQLTQDLGSAQATDRACPRCQQAMEEKTVIHSDLQLDQCPGCEGLWFDQGELGQTLGVSDRTLQLEIDPSVAVQSNGDGHDEQAHDRLREIAAGRRSLPNLFLRSLFLLAVLYSFVGIILIACVELQVLGLELAIGIGIGIILIQYLLSPWIMDLSLRWLYSLTWVKPDDLPPHLQNFVQKASEERGFRFPDFGIIDDGSPNAFTYGHTPRNMRIVITRGLMELLEPEEVEAVVAHEIGHGQHWDILIMTFAQMVPLLLYYIYRTLIRSRSGGGNKKGQGGQIAIAIGAYVLYIISEYCVLWLSRSREYHADRYAGELTGNPNALAAALVKIGYGLAAQKPGEDSESKGKKKKDGEEEKRGLDAIGALGIFDAQAAKGLVVASSGASSSADEVNKESLKSAMQWDLWNPWAKYYELHSTHPLIAHRLQYLAEQSASKGIEPYVVFDRRKPESYWDDFFADIIIMFLPVIGFLAGVVGWFASGAIDGDQYWWGVAIAMAGLGSFLKLRAVYRGRFFAPLSIAGLLHKIKVSEVRPVPVMLRGTIIGRGVPGLIWSEDFVMRDSTGILFLDYRQPLRIWEWFFGLLKAKDLQNQDMEVTGWYRRAPVPYLEIKTLTVGGKTRNCYSRHMRYAIAIIGMVGGAALALYLNSIV